MSKEALKLALEAYLCREMPAGTIIGDPKWWAPKIAMAVREALAQPEQEPVAVKHMMEWVDYLKRKSDYGQHMKIPSEMSAGACWELAIELEQFIYTTSPQRKPLSDEEIERACVPLGAAMLSFTEVARAIEAAHGIKE